MNTQLATTSGQDMITETTLVSYLDFTGMGKKLTEQEKGQFLHIAQVYGLNPFKREIYVTKYGEGQYAQFAIITGYEVYLKRAERTGKLDGWDASVFAGDGDDLSCTCTIHRKDWSRPFQHTVFYGDVVQKKKDGTVNAFWAKKRQQLRKVTISQAFRLAFPDELGGIPYTKDEMSVEVQEVDYQEAPNAQPTQPTQTATVVQPESEKLSKRELADAAAALTAWQNEFDQIEVTPEAYLAHGQKLESLKGLSRENMTLEFRALCNVAAKRGIDWSKKDKVFYWNPDAVDTGTGEVYETQNAEVA